MKSLTVLVTCILGVSCNSGYESIIAKLVYVEPFPFANELGHHAAMANTQAAWIVPNGQSDSLAVLFDYNTTQGDDICKLLFVGNVYEFRLTKFVRTISQEQDFNTKSRDSASQFISSLPVHSLIDSNKTVQATQYWLVVGVK